MEHNWMRIMEPTGDDPIGAALVRLAQRAAAVHRFEAAKRAQRDAAADGTDRTNRPAPRPAMDESPMPHRADPLPYEEVRH